MGFILGSNRFKSIRRGLIAARCRTPFRYTRGLAGSGDQYVDFCGYQVDGQGHGEGKGALFYTSLRKVIRDFSQTLAYSFKLVRNFANRGLFHQPGKSLKLGNIQRIPTLKLISTDGWSPLD